MEDCDCREADAADCHAQREGVDVELVLEDGLQCDCNCHQEPEDHD